MAKVKTATAKAEPVVNVATAKPEATIGTSGAAAFDAFLGTAETKASTKGKKTYPAITLPDNISKNLVKFLAYKAEMKNAESNMRGEEAPIIEHVFPLADEKRFSGLASDTTFDLIGKDASGRSISVKFQPTDKWSIKEENINAMKDLLGDKFDEAIYLSTEVKLKAEVLENEALKTEFINLIGAANMAKFFDTPKKTWTYRKGLLDNVHKICKTAETLTKFRSLANPAKPSLK